MVKRSDMTPEEVALMEKAGQEIVDALRGIPLEVDGAPNATLKYKDGSYKVRPILAGWNFFIEYGFLGKKGEIIFGLSPEDSQEYEFAEFSHKAMDTVFPLAGSTLADKLGLEGENFRILFDKLIIRQAEAAIQAKAEADRIYSENPNYGLF